MVQAEAFVEELFLSIQGEGAEVGKTQLFLRLSGCPLRCAYCDTPESWTKSETCKVWLGDSPDLIPSQLNGQQILEQLDRIVKAHHVERQDLVLSVTGGEPLVQWQFLQNWLPQLDGKVMLETAGIWPQRLAALSAHLDMVSLDWKLPSTMLPSEVTANSSECLQALVESECEYWIKIVLSSQVSPGELDSALNEIVESSPGQRVFLQPLSERPGAPSTVSAKFLQAALLRNQPLGLDLRVLPQIHPQLNIL